MKVSIHQPNFLPWLGFFHKIINSDVFVLFDNVQFPRGRSYSSRVAIKTMAGQKWLTVPVEKNGFKKINEIKIIEGVPWKRKHLKTLETNYKRAGNFQEIYSLLERIYNQDWHYLADFNIELIKEICSYLAIETKLVRSSEITSGEESGINHIIEIIKNTGVKTYLSGTGAGAARYNDPALFKQNMISLEYQSFSHPVYNQLWTGFIPNLSIVDLLFNCGRNSLDILRNSSV